jgi:hypothetical protein
VGISFCDASRYLGASLTRLPDMWIFDQKYLSGRSRSVLVCVSSEQSQGKLAHHLPMPYLDALGIFCYTVQVLKKGKENIG